MKRGYLIALIVRPKTIHCFLGKRPPIVVLGFLNTHLSSPVPNLNGRFRLFSIFHFSVELERFLFSFDQSESLSVEIGDHVLVFEVLRE